VRGLVGHPQLLPGQADAAARHRGAQRRWRRRSVWRLRMAPRQPARRAMAARAVAAPRARRANGVRAGAMVGQSAFVNRAPRAVHVRGELSAGGTLSPLAVGLYARSEI